MIVDDRRVIVSYSFFFKKKTEIKYEYNILNHNTDGLR
jgi:hypothetical protein